jgi:hypothetical protein
MQAKFVAVGLQSTGPSRKETFLGRAFRVIPAVFVRSQVLRNNLGTCFLPQDDITDEWANIWNGTPVLVGPHPMDGDDPASGREAQLWNERLGGWIFAAKAVQESTQIRHLAGEVWLDESRADAVDGLKAVLERVDAGEPVELSTGFRAKILAQAGVFQGSAYESVLHPDGADHLVISTEMTGACSVSDGCGLGVNKFQGTPPMENTNTPAVEEGTKTGGATEETSKTEQAEQGLWAKVKARFTKQRDDAASLIEARFKLDEQARAVNGLPVSDMEKQSRIRAALQEKLGSNGDVIIADVFSTDSVVIFWMITPFGPEPQGSNYFRATFSEGSDGVITFGEAEKVRRVTAYELVGNEAGKPSTGTATNCNCAPTEGANMSKEAAEKTAMETLTEAVGNLAKTVQGLASDVAGIKQAAEQDPNPSIAGLKKTMGELASTVQSMATVTKTAVEERDRERRALVESLAGNYRVPFTEADLEAKPIEELRKIAQMAGAEDYSGRGGPRSASNSSQGARFVEPVPYFQKPEAGKGGK